MLDRELSRIIALLDRDLVLRETTRLLTERFGFHCSWVAEREDGIDGVLIGHVDGNRTRRFPGTTLRPGCGLGGKVYVSGRTEWVDDYVASEAITHEYDGVVSDESIRRIIASPIGSGTEPVGVLLGGLRDGGMFGDRAAAIVETVAERTAQALIAAERAQQNAQAAVHEERSRMALDLHDSVGAMLFAITASVRSATAETAIGEPMRERLFAIERQASEAAMTLRESLRALRTPAEQLALGAALQAACSAFEQRSNIDASLVMLDVLAPLPDARLRALVASAREGLLNVQKHAAATRVVVTVANMRGGVAVTVRDDGVGLRPQADDHRGFGIEAIAETLAEVGGSLQVAEDGDSGVSFRGWVPY